MINHPALTSLTENIQQTQNWLEEILNGIRTGRASPALIEQLPVACYGSISPLLQVASIQAPEPHLLVIQPWDPGVIKDIEKALQQSSLGITPVVDGKNIRLPFPPMTEERRLQLSKTVKEKGEQAKIRIRTARESALKLLRQGQPDKSLSEDAIKAGEKEIQNQIDQGSVLIESLVEKKITDLTSL